MSGTVHGVIRVAQSEEICQQRPWVRDLRVPHGQKCTSMRQRTEVQNESIDREPEYSTRVSRYVHPVTNQALSHDL